MIVRLVISSISFQQAAIVGLQFLGYVGMHSQHDVFVFEMLGDLPHLHVDLIANSGDGLHIAGRHGWSGSWRKIG